MVKQGLRYTEPEVHRQKILPITRHVKTYNTPLVKLIRRSGPTKWRLPQWPGPRHKSKPKSFCPYKERIAAEET